MTRRVRVSIPRYDEGVVLEPLGDSLVIVRELGGRASEVAHILSTFGVAGVTEVVPAYQTVGVYVEPEEFDLGALRAAIDGWDGAVAPGLAGETHEIPVWFGGGEDLDQACSVLGVTRERFTGLFCEAELDVFAVGFSPGFPYLGYLPPELSGLERRANPRPRIAAGTVAITGQQAGIYPSETPGGWWLIGRTPVKLFDAGSRWTRFRTGDRVRFVEVGAAEYMAYEED